jgi:hypothetical protein
MALARSCVKAAVDLVDRDPRTHPTQQAKMVRQGSPHHIIIIIIIIVECLPNYSP